MVAEYVCGDFGCVSIVQRQSSPCQLFNDLNRKAGELGNPEKRSNGCRTIPLRLVPPGKPEVEIVQIHILGQRLIQHLQVPIEPDCLFHLISFHRPAEVTGNALNRLILQGLKFADGKEILATQPGNAADCNLGPPPGYFIPDFRENHFGSFGNSDFGFRGTSSQDQQQRSREGENRPEDHKTAGSHRSFSRNGNSRRTESVQIPNSRTSITPSWSKSHARSPPSRARSITSGVPLSSSSTTTIERRPST